ncbi:hypothetical protein GOODEAATRI_031614, partial [Goodea atripinnis]
FSGVIGLIFFLELIVAVLAVVFQSQVREWINEFFLQNIKAYRDDIDLQNLIDSLQKMCGYDVRNRPQNDWSNHIFVKGCIKALEDWLPGNLYTVAIVFVPLCGQITPSSSNHLLRSAVLGSSRLLSKSEQAESETRNSVVALLLLSVFQSSGAAPPPARRPAVDPRPQRRTDTARSAAEPDPFRLSSAPPRWKTPDGGPRCALLLPQAFGPEFHVSAEKWTDSPAVWVSTSSVRTQNRTEPAHLVVHWLEGEGRTRLWRLYTCHCCLFQEEPAPPLWSLKGHKTNIFNRRLCSPGMNLLEPGSVRDPIRIQQDPRH